MPPKLRRSVFSSILEDEDFAFVESPDDELTATESDVCLCGLRRGLHNEDGKIEGKCKGFQELK